MQYYGSERFWEGLRSPEAYDGARASELAERRRRYRFAFLSILLGLIGQGGCWRFVLSDDYNEYGVIPILLSGLIGWWAIQSGLELWKSAEDTVVREPRMHIEEAIAYEERRLRALRTQIPREAVPVFQKWFRDKVEGVVREQYEATAVSNRLGELKRKVASLSANAQGLVERELQRNPLWEQPSESSWAEASTRIAQSLSIELERAGYRAISSGPNLTLLPSWKELPEAVDRLRKLRELRLRQDAEQAWRRA